MASGQFTSDGVSDEFVVRNGSAVIALDGNYGGGTVSVQRKHEGSGNWQTLGSYNSASDPVVAPLSALGPSVLRLQLQGASSPTLWWELSA